MPGLAQRDALAAQCLFIGKRKSHPVYAIMPDMEERIDTVKYVSDQRWLAYYRGFDRKRIVP
jgi:hypothetical protein